MSKTKKTERRDRQFNIGLTAREYDLLHQRADALRMRPVDYGRAKLFAQKRITEAAERHAACPDPLIFVQLSRLGNNLNQIARKLHEFHIPLPETLEPLLQEIRALINRVRDQ